MADKQVTVYSTPTCPWCTRVKEYLSQKGVKFEEKNVAQDTAAAKEMIEKSKQMAVPVIIIGDEIIVGFDQATIDKLLA